MNVPLLILYGARFGRTHAAAVQAGAIAQDHGYRVRVLELLECHPERLEAEERVLFILGGSHEAGRGWQEVVARKHYDLQHLRFSILTLAEIMEGETVQGGLRLEATLTSQLALLTYPRLDCHPDDEVSIRVWLCGALAALKTSVTIPNPASTEAGVVATPSPEGGPAGHFQNLRNIVSLKP